MNFDQFVTHSWLVVTLGVIGAVLIAFMFCFGLVKILGHAASRTSFKFDTALVSALPVPLTLLSLAFVVFITQKLLVYTEISTLPGYEYSDTALKIIMILALIFFGDRLSQRVISQYAQTSEVMKSGNSVLKGIAKACIYIIGIMILMGTLGISITPLLASVGITSLAVALALQPTLENFFSGIQMIADKPIRVGDFIELDSGEQGFVDRIGWRSTWIRMLPNNTIIMPNSVLSKSKIINYFYPEKELSVPVDVGVHYSSDLEHVERVTLEVAREILISHEWGVDDYDTFVVYTGFGDSSINFTVMLRAKEYFNRFWVKSAFIKALHQRFAEEGIVIPYPIRAVNTSQENPSFPFKSVAED